ncbi:unnamed protein product, partial [Mesorhabditis spiculigera]
MPRAAGVLAPRYRRAAAAEAAKASAEDDGTQVERPSRPAAKKSAANVSKKRAPNKDEKFEKALRQFALDNIKLTVPKMVDEFVAIKTDTQGIGKYTKAAFDANPEKNRYKDVYCVDGSRVVLNWPASKSDYIHGNWVHIPEKRRFICTQAPTETTIEDFWRMMWQEKCRSIVMLCNLVEQGKRKCEQYWPNEKGTTMDSGPVSVKCLSIQDVEEVLTLTRLELTTAESKDTLIVEHLCWNNWPDRGVPPNFLACLRLINRVKDLTPIVVHCSAGIGRTGTIVGLDVIMARLQKGENCTVDKVVRELRDARHGSVQMDIQYVYIARVLIALAENKKLVTKEELRDWLADYETLCKARGC